MADHNGIDILKKYQWLQDKGLEMVVNTDLDGLLCATLLSHALDWRIVGFYDINKIWLIDTFSGELESLVFIDADITRPPYRSMGHHIVLETHRYHLNPNVIFGKSLDNFETKYPLGTIIFLLWLLQPEMPDNDEVKYWLLHADSAWRSYYGLISQARSARLLTIITENVLDWLENKLGQLRLGNFLRSQTKEQFNAGISQYIIEHSWGKDAQQCQFKIRLDETGHWVGTHYERVTNLTQHISKVLKMKTLGIPTTLRVAKTFTRFRVSSYNPDVFPIILDYFGEDVFAHGMTVFKPLTLEVALDSPS